MSYMENKMDNLIESGIHAYEEYCRVLDLDIENYIKEKGYTWTVENILSEYLNKYCKGDYISHTAKDVIIKFKERLEKSTGRCSK